ncbi:MAG: Rne/Rng family ribonuclease, partial [Actinobacteria bacterium]|nr:Rne/Rng family ribonuclease [Actinomycetota bacterium]
MTDETTTRTRRRVRVRANDDQSGGAERTRRRSPEPGAAETDGDGGRPRTTSTTTDATPPAQRRVRKRRMRGGRDRGTDQGPDDATAPADGGAADDDTPTADAAPSMDDATASERRPDTARRRQSGTRGGRSGGATSRDATSGGARSGRKPKPAQGGDQKTSKEEDRAPQDRSAGTDESTADAKESGRKGNQRNRKGRRRQGSAPRGGLSEEVRRSITEGPPRRMLVSVGSQRTEVAVLEERDLVEHYVTRKANESYVGNIYLGRVQNVLPGMEAAFVDIGKGRNGVLYAGEVNYDDEDVESKAPRIEQALKPGQTVVVQVTKDPMGTKGARLTQQLSLAGRFCVLAIEDGTVGISRKLTDAERDRLRDTLKAIKPDGYGLIVRTAASSATDEQLEADVARLLQRWEQIRHRLEDAKPLTEVYREPELAMRVIRDVYGSEFTELICDDAELSDQIQEYLEDVTPDLVDTLRRYDGDQPLFTAYEITNQVRRALEKKVWLASGGYLIVEKTEAMWVIDVNTGKFVGDSNLEETVLRNNLEAAEEIARQLRLRDMGGIIVIDFVDMLLPANRDEVLKRFKRELARDKTKSRVMEISKLGLV